MRDETPDEIAAREEARAEDIAFREMLAEQQAAEFLAAHPGLIEDQDRRAAEKQLAESTEDQS